MNQLPAILLAPENLRHAQVEQYRFLISLLALDAHLRALQADPVAEVATAVLVQDLEAVGAAGPNVPAALALAAMTWPAPCTTSPRGLKIVAGD